MLILPDLTTPDITAKPDLKSLFSGPFEVFSPDLMTLTFQLSYVIFFLLWIFIQALIQYENKEKCYNINLDTSEQDEEWKKTLWIRKIK